VTTCKLCRLSVYKGQPSVWLSKPMGINHTECAEREGLL
jgi:hypothetical protein